MRKCNLWIFTIIWHHFTHGVGKSATIMSQLSFQRCVDRSEPTLLHYICCTILNQGGFVWTMHNKEARFLSTLGPVPQIKYSADTMDLIKWSRERRCVAQVTADWWETLFLAQFSPNWCDHKNPAQVPSSSAVSVAELRCWKAEVGEKWEQRPLAILRRN